MCGQYRSNFGYSLALVISTTPQLVWHTSLGEKYVHNIGDASAHFMLLSYCHWPITTMLRLTPNNLLCWQGNRLKLNIELRNAVILKFLDIT